MATRKNQGKTKYPSSPKKTAVRRMMVKKTLMKK